MTLNRRQFTISLGALALALAPLPPFPGMAAGKAEMVFKELWLSILDCNGAEVTKRTKMISEGGNEYTNDQITFPWVEKVRRTSLKEITIGVYQSEHGPLMCTSVIDLTTCVAGPGEMIKLEALEFNIEA